MEWITLITCPGTNTIQMLPSDSLKDLGYPTYAPLCEEGEWKQAASLILKETTWAQANGSSENTYFSSMYCIKQQKSSNTELLKP